jgi:hypothetical protein
MTISSNKNKDFFFTDGVLTALEIPILLTPDFFAGNIIFCR